MSVCLYKHWVATPDFPSWKEGSGLYVAGALPPCCYAAILGELSFGDMFPSHSCFYSFIKWLQQAQAARKTWLPTGTRAVPSLLLKRQAPFSSCGINWPAAVRQQRRLDCSLLGVFYIFHSVYISSHFSYSIFRSQECVKLVLIPGFYSSLTPGVLLT